MAAPPVMRLRPGLNIPLRWEYSGVRGGVSAEEGGTQEAGRGSRIVSGYYLSTIRHVSEKSERTPQDACTQAGRASFTFVRCVSDGGIRLETRCVLSWAPHRRR